MAATSSIPFAEIFGGLGSSFQESPEAAVGANARGALRECLSLAESNERVGHWLFADKDYPYVEDGPQLSPQAFRSSMALQISHRVDTPPSTMMSLAALSGANKLSDTDFSIEAVANVLMTPACDEDCLLFGYGMMFSSYMRPAALSKVFPLPGSMSDKPHINSRFVYDRRSKQLLIVINAVTLEMTLIVSFTLTSAVSRQHYAFSVDNRQYGPGDLPDRPYQVTSNLHYTLSPMGDFPFSSSSLLSEWPQSSEDPDALFDWVKSQTANSTGLPGNSCSDLSISLPFSDWISTTTSSNSDDAEAHCDFGLGNMTTAEKIGEMSSVPSHDIGCSRVVAKNDQIGKLSAAISELQVTLSGRFVAPNFKRDVLDPDTGEMREQLTGRMSCEMAPSVQDLRNKFVKYAAQCYYLAAINAVSGGERIRSHTSPAGLVPSFRPGWEIKTKTNVPIPFSASNLTSSSAQPQPQSQPSTLSVAPLAFPFSPSISLNADTASAGVVVPTSAVPLLPRSLMPTAGSAGASVPSAFQLSKQQRDYRSAHEIKLEEKRRRNRESAARSNLKRKLREQQQEAELEELKARVVWLRQRQNQLYEENGKLRAAVP